jgi:hypothetical protein
MKKKCKVMALDEKIKTLDKLRGDTRATAVGQHSVDILL